MFPDIRNPRTYVSLLVLVVLFAIPMVYSTAFMTNLFVLRFVYSALAVAWNEALRILMEDIGFTPEFQITPEQQSFLAGTAYADDPDFRLVTHLL